MIAVCYKFKIQAEVSKLFFNNDVFCEFLSYDYFIYIITIQVEDMPKFTPVIMKCARTT